MVIYKATNTINGKVYIGKTMHPLNKRAKEHIKGSKHAKTYFHSSLKKYGAESFEWKIIQECLTVDHLNLAEKAYIELYKMKGIKLYNMTSGGDGISKPSEEMRKKISVSLKGKCKGRKTSDETKQKLRILVTGRTMSNNAKEKNRVAHVGKKTTEITKAKMSETQKRIGNKPPSMAGKKFTKEHCENLSKAMKKSGHVPPSRKGCCLDKTDKYAVRGAKCLA